MTDQRLVEEILDGIRALRQSDTETKVKLEGIRVQLESMTSMRGEFEDTLRQVADHHLRLEAMEELRLDARLKKVEGTTFKIVAGALTLIGVIELLDKASILLRGL